MYLIHSVSQREIEIEREGERKREGERERRRERERDGERGGRASERCIIWLLYFCS